MASQLWKSSTIENKMANFDHRIGVTNRWNVIRNERFEEVIDGHVMWSVTVSTDTSINWMVEKMKVKIGNEPNYIGMAILFKI